MSKSKVKYYAVKEGNKIGIFTSWDECKKQVIGYSGAIYKSFPTQNEAENYLSGIEKSNKFHPNKNGRYIFCDGSEIKGTDKAGYGIYYPDLGLEENFQLPGGTNNQAEIKAIIRAFEIIDSEKNNKKLEYIIISDSRYVINSLLEWIPKWKTNSWKKSDGKIIENLELIKELDSLYQKLLKSGIKIKLMHLNSHQKKPSNQDSVEYYLWYGNYMADLLAKQ